MVAVFSNNINALFHESLNTYRMAGFLTYPHSGRPSRFFMKQWQRYLAGMLYRAYSSGSVQDFHLIPFYIAPPIESTMHQYEGKDSNILPDIQLFFINSI